MCEQIKLGNHGMEMPKAFQAEKKVPKNIWKIVFRHLSPGDLVKASLTCKTWNQIITNDQKLKAKRAIVVYAFGKTKWEKHIGTIGAAPPPSQGHRKDPEQPLSLLAQQKGSGDPPSLPRPPKHQRKTPHPKLPGAAHPKPQNGESNEV